MSSISSTGASRGRRRLTGEIRASMRELSSHLALLNHQVCMRLDLRDVDLDCLDLVDRHGPLGPTALARVAGLHPATVTGVLDRLERGGWVVRERAPDDRRAVRVRVLRERSGEVRRLYAGMISTMERICAGYDEAELRTVADFLARTAEAGRSATDELAAG